MKIEDFRKLAYVDILVYVDLKTIGSRVHRPHMQMVFKFQDNWMKIEDFRKLAYVDLLVYVDVLAYFYLKINRWLNLLT